MLRRPLPRTLTDGATDVLHPLMTVSRGLRQLATRARRGWARAPKEHRGRLLFLVTAGVFALAVIPYGPLLALIGLMGAAGWAGRARPATAPGPAPAEATRLQALYDALVPYFRAPEDAGALYRFGGEWSEVFDGYAFDEQGRPTLLRLRYPAYFTDGEPESRARVEQLLYAKSGRGREYLFEWDEEGNRLTVSVLPPLPTDIGAQRFVTAPGETVLGFTDPGEVDRTLPVSAADGQGGMVIRDAPPVVWRTGPRSGEPHLLVLGPSGSGTTTLLRSITLQALHSGEVLLVDGGGTGDYDFLAGRCGVLAVESGPAGTRAALEWAAHETERRLIAAQRARQLGQTPPEEVHRPLWIVVDRPSVLSQLAAAGAAGQGGEPVDPQELLVVPLRHGRAANVSVVVADQCDSAEALADQVLSHTRARVVLGAAGHELVTAVLGAPPHTTPTHQVPPGRGYVRLGNGPVHRLQVPATPDPYDPAIEEPLRQAVLELLPDPLGPAAPVTDPAGPGVERRAPGPPGEATEGPGLTKPVQAT